MRLYKKCSKK